MSYVDTNQALARAAQVAWTDPTANTALPPLARLTAALRAPLLPVIGFAELSAGDDAAEHHQAWAREILASSRQMLAVLDCTSALAAGRPPTTADAATLASATEAVAALRQLMQQGHDHASGAADCHQ